MKKCTNFLWLPICVLALISLTAIDVRVSLAGDYPDKWYGWYCPGVEMKVGPPYRGAAFQDQKIIRSWGYEANDVDEIKDLLPEGFFNIVKNPDIWGPIRINETAYIPRDQWGENVTRMNEATEKYKGEPYLDKKGHIQNYKAGIPFPGSENGLEIIWNLTKRRVFGEVMLGKAIMTNVDRKGRNRYTDTECNYLYFNGRLWGDPKPVYKPNPHNYEHFQSYGYHYPYDLRGTVPLMYRYDDPDKQDDMWMYLPTLRRVRRMSAAQRWDRLPGGSNCTWDTIMGFQGKPTNYEWKYLGRKELMCGHNTEWGPPQMLKDKPAGGVDLTYQRVNTVVIELTPKPHMVAPISRGVLYLDPEAYIPYYVEYYDKRGRLWQFHSYTLISNKRGEAVECNCQYYDVQRITNSTVYPFDLYHNNDAAELADPANWTMEKLRRYYGGR